MISLLSRTKDPRAVPLVLAQLNGSTGNRRQVIHLLGQIGDQSVAETLVKKYPDLSGGDKAAALNALQQLKSPSFRKLAGEALLSADASEAASAVSGLQNDGSTEAIRMLAQALDKSTDPAVWKRVAQALATLGTSEAQAALRRARDTGSEEKRAEAIEALAEIRKRSPGFGYVYQAMMSEQDGKWDEAAAHYSTAIEIDPDLPDAYAGRGHSLLMLNKSKEAQADFRKAVELDPFNSVAVTGLAITFVLEGKIDEGLKSVEDVRAKFSRDQLYFYNTACVYGRAVEALQKADDKTPDRQKKLADWRSKALADLRSSMKLGFQNTDWMKKDPDLNSLHDLPDFQKLINPGPGPDAEKNKQKEESGEDAPDPTDKNEQVPEEIDPEKIEADINFLEAAP